MSEASADTTSAEAGTTKVRAGGGAPGFTLAEVLIAMAVVSIAAVSSLYAITAAMRTVRSTRDAEEVGRRAEALVGQWRVDGWPEGDRAEGDFEDRPDVRWTIEFRPARIPGVPAGLEEATLTVRTEIAERSFVLFARREEG